jgi:hypothetical protein
MRLQRINLQPIFLNHLPQRLAWLTLGEVQSGRCACHPMNKQRHDCETTTITVSKQFLTNAKEMSRLLGYSEDDLGRIIEEYGWPIADALGDLHSDLEDRTWKNEQECQQVAARVFHLLRPNTVIRVGRVGNKWVMRFFQKDSPRLYLWDTYRHLEQDEPFHLPS